MKLEVLTLHPEPQRGFRQKRDFLRHFIRVTQPILRRQQRAIEKVLGRQLTNQLFELDRAPKTNPYVMHYPVTELVSLHSNSLCRNYAPAKLDGTNGKEPKRY